MSRMPAQYQRPGYTNGRIQVNGQHDAGRERGMNGTADETSTRTREGRSGGYGGFSDSNDRTPGLSSADTGRRSPVRLGAFAPSGTMPWRGPDRDDGPLSESGRLSERDHGRLNGTGWSRQGTGPGSRRIEEVIQQIQQDWDFMTDEKCVPVQVALNLMDSSSLGRAHQYDQFQATHKQLQRALKAIVNEHHQGFSSSLGTFHQVQDAIVSSQQRVQTLKETLIQAKGSLSTGKPELRSLAMSSQRYDEMLQTLGQIEQLELIPEKLEARISEKHFLSAVQILQEALSMIRQPQMQDIGALSDLRIYLDNQENSMTDILIEELHSHLYLKSPYCTERWKPYSKPEGGSPTMNGKALSTILAQGSAMYRFLQRLNVTEPMSEDASRNPETDSFYYIHLLIESLHKMNRLEVAVDTIEQRMPVELFRVVDRTNIEVAQRHPDNIRNASRRKQKSVEFGLGDKEARTSIISDLLWTLYAKFEAIAEGHRVMHDVIKGITQRQAGADASALMGGFKELWKLYQSEIRSLLHDYLATDGSTAARQRQSQSAGNVGLFQRIQRDKDKKLFKLANIDHKSVDISTEQEDLESILKASVPGLVSDSRRPQDTIAEDASQQQHDHSATGHRLLVEPSVFNMGLLLPPSLSFIKKLKEIVPPDSDIIMSTLTSFLDDFLVNVFHPQLDETLVELSALTFMDAAAFQQDPEWSKVAKHPILRSTSNFYSLITAFCDMLDTIPHDQAFSQLIIAQMTTYHDKCQEWFNSLTARSQSPNDGSPTKSAAELASSGKVHDVLLSLFSANDATEKKKLLEKEHGLLILATNDDVLGPSDLISDRRSTTSLCLLHTSMRWLAAKSSALRHITANTLDTSSHPNNHARFVRRWTLVNSTPHLPSDNPPSDRPQIYLPMTPDTVQHFDSVLTSYNNLSKLSLLTLHLSLRFSTIYHISLSLRDEPYLLPYTPITSAVPQLPIPSQSILALNSGLTIVDEVLDAHLPRGLHDFLIHGLALLSDTVLVSSAGQIGALNQPGRDRVLLNIFILQQNLRNIETNGPYPPVLRRSQTYFSLFSKGADGILDGARAIAAGEGIGEGQEKYTYDEFKTLMELAFSERLQSERREIAMQAKRELGEKVLGLSEILWAS